MNLSIYYGILFLWGTLAVATLLAWAVEWTFPVPELKRVQLRIKTWFYIIAVFSTFFFLPRSYTNIFLCLLGLLALWEIWKTYYALSKKSTKIGMLSVCLSGLVIVCLVSAHYLYELNLSAFFLIVVLTQLDDIFQYLWGKSLGKRLIIPAISPTKTWAGFWGGVITSGLFSCIIAPYFIETGRIQALVLGGIIACLGFVGDITVSFFKRQCSVKDLGTLLPGHGGLLDRIDSLLYVLPLMAYVFTK